MLGARLVPDTVPIAFASECECAYCTQISALSPGSTAHTPLCLLQMAPGVAAAAAEVLISHKYFYDTAKLVYRHRTPQNFALPPPIHPPLQRDTHVCTSLPHRADVGDQPIDLAIKPSLAGQVVNWISSGQPHAMAQDVSSALRSVVVQGRDHMKDMSSTHSTYTQTTPTTMRYNQTRPQFLGVPQINQITKYKFRLGVSYTDWNARYVSRRHTLTHTHESDNYFWCTFLS